MFTLDEVVTSALQAVGEKGADYVYANPQCVYAEYDESDCLAPSCLVGWVMNDLDPELFREIANSSHNGSPLGHLANLGCIPHDWADVEAMKFLVAAQYAQDGMIMTWLEAINSALEEIGEQV